VTKRLPRRDAKRRLSLQEMLVLRGNAAGSLRLFGDKARLRSVYEAHREEIDRFGHPGIRSAAWWLLESGAPTELVERPSSVGVDPTDAIKDREEIRARRLLWLHENGHLEEWEREDIIAWAKRDLHPPNEFWGPSPEQQATARRILKALES
jgi:hypothetical protein